MNMTSSKQPKEESLPIYDQCLADALVKTGKYWPVVFGAGLGIGVAYSNCQHKFSKQDQVQAYRVRATDTATLKALKLRPNNEASPDVVQPQGEAASNHFSPLLADPPAVTKKTCEKKNESSNGKEKQNTLQLIQLRKENLEKMRRKNQDRQQDNEKHRRSSSSINNIIQIRKLTAAAELGNESVVEDNFNCNSETVTVLEADSSLRRRMISLHSLDSSDTFRISCRVRTIFQTKIIPETWGVWNNPNLLETSGHGLLLLQLTQGTRGKKYHYISPSPNPSQQLLEMSVRLQQRFPAITRAGLLVTLCVTIRGSGYPVLLLKALIGVDVSNGFRLPFPPGVITNSSVDGPPYKSVSLMVKIETEQLINKGKVIVVCQLSMNGLLLPSHRAHKVRVGQLSLGVVSAGLVAMAVISVKEYLATNERELLRDFWMHFFVMFQDPLNLLKFVLDSPRNLSARFRAEGGGGLHP
ncbi:unnamed protein product [Notodromas monacha]|uniref:MICOS complex subunit MIC10 n=1 Tax=Notodromas monacha TaxID=399045 RepID=A0A7R9GHW8_9CRUS|nr:unnamed protein product [Notodromas monacha]CAG0921961.1 unnamed protein product [Notodromas monacha]